MKYLKRVLLITLILMICIITTWFIIKKYYLIDMVHARIEKSIDKNIENDFQFIFDDFEINWFSHNAKLSGFNLFLLDQTDTVGYFKGDLTIHIRGWRNIIFDKKKIIKNIVLTGADLYYVKNCPFIMKDGIENQEVEISNLSAIGKLHLTDEHKEQSGQLTSNFDISVDLNYNSKNEFSVYNLIKQVTTFKVSEFHYYLPDGFYQLKIKVVTFTNFEDIALKNVIINPVDSRKTFAKRKKVATDYISVAIDSIQLCDFDSQLDKQIYIDQIHLFQPNFDVYKDKNYPEDPEYIAILVDLLQELKTPVYIKTMELNNMFIKYTQLANQAKEAGDLYFSDANATVSNITNVKDSLQLSSNILIEAEAKFYGEGKLKTSMNYDMLSSSGQFGVEGSLGSMDIIKVNDIISKLVPIKIESGQLESLRFNFSGSRNHSDGEMWFEYSNLKMELLETNYWNSNFTRNVMSNIGNTMLRNSNPSNNGTFKIGEINQDRNITKSMFNYWWVSLQSGFLSTLGVNAEKQKIYYKSGKSTALFDK